MQGFYENFLSLIESESMTVNRFLKSYSSSIRLVSIIEGSAGAN